MISFFSAGDYFEPDQTNSAKDNWTDRLYKDKMKGYNKAARPVKDHTHNTTLYMALALNHIDLVSQ